eukprot:GHVN01091484.1.p1 GENE.GHVN01091484.1~~GHVN01091484.1.p1  ORF type:complete len:320 (+),score=41.35 GHVN01091484.1:1024-1983(+)
MGFWMLLDGILDEYRVALGCAFFFLVAFYYSTRFHTPTKSAFLNKQRQSLKLADKKELSKDTFRFRFAFPNSTSFLGLPVGKHIKFYVPNVVGEVKGQWNGRPDEEDGESEIERKYTPVTGDEVNGYVDFVIKSYRPKEHPRFPDGGKCSFHMEKMKVGDSIALQGPFGSLEYIGAGVFTKSGKALEGKTKIGMIAGGSGITPMLQIINKVLSEKGSRVELFLVYGNQSREDILCKDMLDELEANRNGQLKVHHTVDKDPHDSSWKGSVGYVTKEMLQKNLPGPSNSIVLLCGPPPLVGSSQKLLTQELNYDSQYILAF